MRALSEAHALSIHSSGLVGSSLVPVGEIEAVKVHHLVPYADEVLHKLRFCIFTCIDFRDRPELRVRAEEQVNSRGGPFEFAGPAIVSLVDATGAVGSWLPPRVHVEQVNEEIIRQCLWTRSENAMLRLPGVRTQGAEATDE